MAENNKTFSDASNNKIDDYFISKFNTILSCWESNIEKLVDILVKNNDIESIAYVMLKYENAKSYINYYVGYNNNINLIKKSIINDVNMILRGAIKAGNLETVKFVFETNKIKYDTYIDIQRLLIMSLVENKVAIFKYIFSISNKSDIRFNNLMRKAALCNNREIYEYLCENANHYDNFYLEYPIKIKDIKIINILLNKLPVFSKIKSDLLILALQNNALDIFKYLYGFSYLYKPCKFNSRNSNLNIQYLNKIVNICVEKKYIDIIKFLLNAYEIYSEYRNYLIQYIHHVASQKNYIDVLEYINDLQKPLMEDTLRAVPNK